MKEKKILSLLGLCRRVGKLISGQEKVESGIRDGKALLVVIASDASGNTKKRFQDKSSFYEVPCYSIFTKEEIGQAIGYEERAVLAVTDEGFADKIMQLFESP